MDIVLRNKIFLEIGKYCLDLSKLVFGGMIIAGIMDMNIEMLKLIGIAFILDILTFCMGIVFLYIGNKKI